ncbi:DinB family protein [Paenibacillus cremeus]|uniref:DUF1572 domain-containing protein n=1 Tax=Paenibacillus cremeus TaxID=2163881 RepID=A0A559K6L2_9BACL|nr:DinB family protein [Paenibacillus cremeus]TVY07785.1 DUF1572 domain-containing protein [Paenibacillus cremeus]
MESIQLLLAQKFGDIENRITQALDQLNDEQVNWRPNESSNSIANLIIHMCGNLNERVGKGILQKPYSRDRDQEFEYTYTAKKELLDLMRATFEETIITTSQATDDMLEATQTVRQNERTNLDILLQCATHMSEHLGQILYIGKMLLDEQYISTSIPRSKR